MDRRTFVKAGILSALDLGASVFLNRGRCRLLAAPRIEISTEAIDLVAEATVIDMLGLLTLDWLDLFRWQWDPRTFEEADFRRLETPGIDIYHPAVGLRERDVRGATLRWLAGWNRLLHSRPCFLQRIDTPRHLTSAPAQGKIGVILGFQNSSHFRTVDDVELFYRLGQRISQLTYNDRNAVGSGCLALGDRGLTPFGVDVIAAMNRVGMAIDLSHCGERTTLEAISASTKPTLVTHANCRALVPKQPRCKSDEVIRALAERGGVMGITVVRSFVHQGSAPSLADVLDHFEHVIRLVGIEYVGIGSDIDVNAADPLSGRVMSPYEIRGLYPAARIFQIADGLLARGYEPGDVRLVLGENFRRALGEIWHETAPSSTADLPERRDPFCPAPAPVLPPGKRTAGGDPATAP